MRASGAKPLCNDPCSSCQAAIAADVPLYASNVELCSLKLLSTELQMPVSGAVPIGGQQPFGSVSSYSGLRAARCRHSVSRFFVSRRRPALQVRTRHRRHNNSLLQQTTRSMFQLCTPVRTWYLS